MTTQAYTTALQNLAHKAFAKVDSVNNRYGYTFSIFLVSIINAEGLVESSQFEVENESRFTVWTGSNLKDAYSYVHLEAV